MPSDHLLKTDWKGCEDLLFRISIKSFLTSLIIFDYIFLYPNAPFVEVTVNVGSHLLITCQQIE